MRSRTKSGRPLWMLAVAAIWISAPAAEAAPPTALNIETTPPIGTATRIQPGNNAVEMYQGTVVGITADGHPFRGNPDAALTLVEYTDYVCPFCALYFQRTLPALLEKYIRTGQIKLVIHDLPLASLHPTAPRGATAAMCVAEQGATRFWQMHDTLFQGQQQWGRLPDPTT